MLWTAYDIPGVPINCCFFMSPTWGPFCHPSSSYLPIFFFFFLLFPFSGASTAGGRSRTVFITNRFSILRYRFVRLTSSSESLITSSNASDKIFHQGNRHSRLRTSVYSKKTNLNQNQINIFVLFQLNLFMQLPKKWSSFWTPSSVYGWY